MSWKWDGKKKTKNLSKEITSADLNEILSGILDGDNNRFIEIEPYCEQSEFLTEQLSAMNNSKLTIISFECAKALKRKNSEVAANLLLQCLLIARKRDKAYCKDLSATLIPKLSPYLDKLRSLTFKPEDEKILLLATFLLPLAAKELLDWVNFERDHIVYKYKALCMVGDLDFLNKKIEELYAISSPNLADIDFIKALRYVEGYSLESVSDALIDIISKVHVQAGAFRSPNPEESKQAWKTASGSLIALAEREKEVESVLVRLLDLGETKHHNLTNGFEEFVTALSASDFSSMVVKKLKKNK